MLGFGRQRCSSSVPRPPAWLHRGTSEPADPRECDMGTGRSGPGPLSLRQTTQTQWLKTPAPRSPGRSRGVAERGGRSSSWAPASETLTWGGLPRGASSPTARASDSHPGPPASARMARFLKGRADGKTRSRSLLLGGAVTAATQFYLFSAQGSSLELCNGTRTSSLAPGSTHATGVVAELVPRGLWLSTGASVPQQRPRAGRDKPLGAAPASTASPGADGGRFLAAGRDVLKIKLLGTDHFRKCARLTAAFLALSVQGPRGGGQLADRPRRTGSRLTRS